MNSHIVKIQSLRQYRIVQTHLFPASLAATDPISQLALLWTHYRRFHCSQQAVIVQENGTRVLIAIRVVLALCTDKTSDPLGQTEEYDNLIDKVCTEIIYSTTA